MKTAAMYLGIALTALVSMPQVALAGETCDGVRTAGYEMDADVRLRDGDVVFAEDGAELARMSRDQRLQVHGVEIALDAHTRKIVGAYVAAYDDLMAEARDIGMAGARLGTRAATGAIRAIFSSAGSRDRFEQEIEAEAAALESRAEALCHTVDMLRMHHEALAAAVPEFADAVPLRD